MTLSGFLWMCNQNWSTLSILIILHFHSKAQKKWFIFVFGKKNWSEKVTGFWPTLPGGGGLGVTKWIFLSE